MAVEPRAVSGRTKVKVRSRAHVSVAASLGARLLFLLARLLLYWARSGRVGQGGRRGRGAGGEGGATAHRPDLQCANKFSAEVKVSPPPTALQRATPMHGIMKERVIMKIEKYLFPGLK